MSERSTLHGSLNAKCKPMNSGQNCSDLTKTKRSNSRPRCRKHVSLIKLNSKMTWAKSARRRLSNLTESGIRSMSSHWKSRSPSWFWRLRNSNAAAIQLLIWSAKKKRTPWSHQWSRYASKKPKHSKTAGRKSIKARFRNIWTAYNSKQWISPKTSRLPGKNNARAKRMR